uniref:Pyruvate phosphate dikinase AMP/ATP-binding domain-containing protein n=1 Tax=Panagrolaimus sp. JU765 TaxID=591449 RepID=A0AC34QZV6_9BILA
MQSDIVGTLPGCFSNRGTSLEMTNLFGVSLTLTNIHFDTKSTSDFLIQVKNQFNSDNTCKNKTTIKASISRIQGYEASSTEKSAFILPLSHRAAQDPNVSGGKGSNLAKLYTLQGNFTVPSGMIVTVTAFENHLQTNPEIQNLIQQLLAISNDEKSVSEMEFQFLTAFKNSTFSMKLQNAIENELIRQFGANHFDASLFAVRSSAVGEDGSELSSAGQLETFLSVKADEIPEKILLCWASNYRREILNYRIQNGQLLNPSVAVVVQKLIYGGKSGVMFTNDPVKGDPNKIVINMIDGLGEALVGGQQTPDEFVINKSLNILKKPKDSEVSNKILENLANLGIFLENVFGKPQDVEFAMKDDHVFVLQSRDITNLDLETDWEFEHEFDTPTISEHDILTTANVG